MIIIMIASVGFFFIGAAVSMRGLFAFDFGAVTTGTVIMLLGTAGLCISILDLLL